MPGKAKGQSHKANQLSAQFVKSVKEPGRYTDGNGLFLQVDASGAKRWAQRIVVRGKRRDIGMGPFSIDPTKAPGITLAQARERAVSNRTTARAGGDPLAHKKQLDWTFEVAAGFFDKEKSSGSLNEKNRKQWRAALERHAMPTIGALNVRDIETSDVERVLRPIWESHTETASRLRARIEAILGYAKAKGARAGENPARWKENLEAMFSAPGKVAKKVNRPAVALTDIARWWIALGEREGIAARALQFQALTGSRSGEVRGMTWDEVDMKLGLWTVPADRMKANREHRVPLSAPALTLLESLPRMSSPHVFPAPQGGMLSDMSLSAVMRRMQQAEEKAGLAGYLDPTSKRPAVPHGLRSTFRQWTAEQGYARDMAEIALAHQVGSDVERAYQRSDMLERRRRMMADWAAFLHGEERGQVVPLRA